MERKKIIHENAIENDYQIYIKGSIKNSREGNWIDNMKPIYSVWKIMSIGQIHKIFRRNNLTGISPN